MPLRVVGFGNNPMAYGAFDCDVHEMVPPIKAEDYIDVLLKHCKRLGIEILIPGHDLDLPILSAAESRFLAEGITILVARSDFIQLCRDKVMMSKVLRPHSEAFVLSYDRTSLLKVAEEGILVYPLIAKPRGGFASRGIVFIHNTDDLNRVTKDHVIQPVVFPASHDSNYKDFCDALEQQTLSQVAEISIQLVVSRSGSLLGRMASYNKLVNGIPIEIIPVDDTRIWESVEAVLPVLVSKGLRGPLNLQGRLNEKGLQLYEMNARFTGITGLRSLMGFNEVEALIADFLGVQDINGSSLKNNPRRIGLRQTGDRCVDRDADVNLKNVVTRTGFYPWERRGKTVLVTGATGYLGISLIKVLVKTSWVEEVVGLFRDEEKANRLRTSAGSEKLRLVSWQDLNDGPLSFGQIDILCHAAFGRPVDGALKIADGLARTQKLAMLIAKFQIPAVLNISSHAVYGLSYPTLWSEDIPPAPETPYAASKWASELIMTSAAQLCPTTRVTSVRLAQLYGLAEGMRWTETPHFLAKSAAFGQPLVIEGGSQLLDYFHISDAVAGILAIMSMSPDNWQPVYNLGSGKPIRLIDLVNIIAESAHRLNGVPVRVDIKASDIRLSLGMSIDRIRKATGWIPQRSIESGIEEIIISAPRLRSQEYLNNPC